MVRKKISELEPKGNLAPTDIIPIVDTELNRRKTKRTTVQDLINEVNAVTQPEKGAAGGVATLDSNARLQPAQLPALAVTETFSVSSEEAMLALPAQMGDLAVREDNQEVYVLQGQNPTVLDNWVRISQAPIAPSAVTLEQLANVDDTIPPDRAVLVYDPDTYQWRPAKLERLTDGGEY
jgi:hypothetical protein